MFQKKQDEIQAQCFLDEMCETLSSDVSCYISYNQIAPAFGLLNEQLGLQSYSSASPHLVADASAADLYQNIAKLYYAECFPHFKAIALPKTYISSQSDILTCAKAVSLTSQFDLQANLLVLPVFGPLNHMGVFIVDMFLEANPDSGDFKSNSILSRIFMASQNCHILTLSNTILASQDNQTKLSQREKEILTWISRGKSNSIIAEILGLSLHTVTGYIRNIYLKTQTNDRTSAAVYALSTGILHNKSAFVNTSSM